MKQKDKKINKILNNIIWGFIVIGMIYNIYYFFYTTITNRNYLKIFGVTILNVNSDNMNPELDKNDLIIVKGNKESLNKNEIIAYASNGKIKISKIKEINIEDNKTTFIVKANNNYYPDIHPISQEQIIGSLVCNITLLGIVIEVLQSKATTIIFFIILIYMFLYNNYKYKKYIERKRKKKNHRLEV